MRFLVLLILLVVCGCSTDDSGPSPAELKAQWDAQNVYPQHYKQDVLAFLRTYLNDPSHILGAAISTPQSKAVGPGPRYVACVRYNARGNDRAYAGEKTGAAIYVQGKLDRFLDGKEAQDLCKGAAYAPFPELEHLTR
jgi:hypothetical protein